MLTRLRLVLYGLLVALTIVPAAAQAKTFYWISHGGPADPVWTYFPVSYTHLTLPTIYSV